MSEHKNHHGGHHKGHADDHLAKRKKTATALKYRDHMKAPQVVANGKGAVADLIIQLARENGIPVEVDPDLAEVLSTLDYYEYIPPELYYAVAQILNKLYDVNQLVGSLSDEEREGRRYAKKGEASVAMPATIGGSDANLIGLNGMDTTGDRVQDSNNAYHSGAVKFGRRNVMSAGAGKPSNSSSSSNASSITSSTGANAQSAQPNQSQQKPTQPAQQNAQPQQKRQMPNNMQNNKVQIATTVDDMPVDLNTITKKGVSNNQNNQPQQPQQPPQVFHVSQTTNGPLGANNQQEGEHNPNIIRSAGSGTKKRANQAQARPKNLKFDTDQILEQFNKRKR